ncbi:MAG: SEC-C domain-containing protein [Proteobacteria bacterium]|nr:SEC-C domain-containing protein [Pseudomonadota bacterium]MBU4472410.1 SEC-C domain-containing protein [Pseudomonadota bacterium]MCG2751007.1 SEC-C domain-containing protein [Desulfobacteraceae bacterium]
MSKISRNSPCPCGSGKKYKKCCLQRDEEKTINKSTSLPQKKNSIKEIEEFYAECNALDNLSNSVVDLIHEGKFDVAENACNELLKLYPDQVDGLERFAMVYEARGNKEKAVEYYMKTADFARSKEGFDPEFVNWALDRAKKLSG